MAARKKNYETDGMRLRTARKLLDALLRLSSRSYTYQELASAMHVGYKTALRSVEALELMGIPIVVDRRENENTGRPCSTFRVDRDWARKRLQVQSNAD